MPFRSRSQAASSVSGAGSVLHIFGGFSEKVDGWALDTQQAVEVTGHSFLQPLGGKKNSFSSRLASAVTLLSGDYILTGGRESGRDVQLLSGTKKQTWTKLSSMLSSRYAHASSPIYLHDEEYVIVAGGYDNLHKPQVTVEIYNVYENIWTLLENLPTPRVHFSLQVIFICIRDGSPALSLEYVQSRGVFAGHTNAQNQ